MTPRARSAAMPKWRHAHQARPLISHIHDDATHCHMISTALRSCTVPLRARTSGSGHAAAFNRSARMPGRSSAMKWPAPGTCVKSAADQRHRLRPRRRRLDTRHLQGPPHRPPAQGRHGLGQHVQRLRHGTPLRRVQAVRLGAGTRRGRHRSLHPGQGREHPVVRGVRTSAGLGGTASPTGASGPWCRPCAPAMAPSWPRPASRSWAVAAR